MCGLFGIYQTGKLLDKDIQKAITTRDTLSYRGPDQAGEFHNNHIFMGHRRLSIIDTSDDGRQPMVSADDNVVITVNGEIYNFQKLRATLVDKGYQFKSHSDSEVVLHGYTEWGANYLAEQMDGMYAIVIYDRSANKLIFIRDRVGIKPLLYYWDGVNFIWSSELGAIEFYKDHQLNINNEALFDYMVYRYIPAPKTVYYDIYKLEPASILTLDITTNSISLQKYWHLPIANNIPEDSSTLKKELLSLLDKSVAEQMVSDVPIGVFLSGGIDSSTIAAFASKFHPHLLSFSVGFHDEFRDESIYSEIVSKFLNTTHHSSYQERNKMDNIIDDMHRWFNEPFGDTSAVPTLKVSQMAREKVTVVLSGDGGDELFGGYLWYDVFAWYRRMQKFNPFIRAKFGLKLPIAIPKYKGIELLTTSDPVVLYARLRGCPSISKLDMWRKKLGISKDYDPFWAYRQHYDSSLPDRKAAQVIDFHTFLPDDILVKVDRMSMLVSVECRPPFLSKNIIEFAFGLAEETIYKNGELKGLLKDTIVDILPHEILRRGKQGFSVPPSSGWKEAIVEKFGTISDAIVINFLSKSGVKKS